jgi:hypothetical protein
MELIIEGDDNSFRKCSVFLRDRDHAINRLRDDRALSLQSQAADLLATGI